MTLSAAFQCALDHRPEQARRTSEVRAPFLLNDSSSAKTRNGLLQEPQTQIGAACGACRSRRIESVVGRRHMRRD